MWILWIRIIGSVPYRADFSRSRSLLAAIERACIVLRREVVHRAVFQSSRACVVRYAVYNAGALRNISRMSRYFAVNRQDEGESMLSLSGPQGHVSHWVYTLSHIVPFICLFIIYNIVYMLINKVFISIIFIYLVFRRIKNNPLIIIIWTFLSLGPKSCSKLCKYHPGKMFHIKLYRIIYNYI